MKIPLSEPTFAVCPEGEHLFLIAKVEEDAKFGKVTLTLKTPDGYTDSERYKILNDDGTQNEGAIKSFSYLARMAMGNLSLVGQFEPTELQGKIVRARAEHTVVESTNTPGKTITFVSLKDMSSATVEEWNNAVMAAKGDTPQEQLQPTATAAPTATKAAFSLDAILGKRK